MHSAQFRLHAQIEQDHWWFTARREILRRIVGEVLPPAPGALIVDVGCGTGANIAALADDYDCVGIDTSAEGIALARRRFPRVEFLVGQAPDDLGSLAAEAAGLTVAASAPAVRPAPILLNRRVPSMGCCAASSRASSGG